MHLCDRMIKNEFFPAYRDFLYKTIFGLNSDVLSVLLM